MGSLIIGEFFPLLALQAMASLGLLDKPFALFGHSFGSLVMFELARTLSRQGFTNLRCLIVAGCRPPNVSFSRQSYLFTVGSTNGAAKLVFVWV